MKPKFLNMLVLALVLGLRIPASGSLTAVVTPGYQFPLDGSVVPSFDLLNQLAQPSIAIYGTIGGSNTISPGSITTVSFSSSVADGVTIGFNGSSPAGLQVLAEGIAGPGLVANTQTNLGLKVDGNYFALATNSPGGTNTTTGNTWLTFKTNAVAANVLKTNWVDWAGTTTNLNATNTYILTATGGTTNLTNTVMQATPLTSVLALLTPAATMCKFSGTAAGTSYPDGANLWRSLNVSSVIRNSTGNYTVTFSNAFTSTNYVLNITASGKQATYSTVPGVQTISATKSNVNFQLVYTLNTGFAAALDADICHLTIFP